MQAIFKRFELKYIMTVEQKKELMKLVNTHMKSDKFSDYTISNLYYDTKDYLLIRRSLEKPFYKEKLRARAYGSVDSSSEIYLEIKKKYEGIVYKRRVSLIENQLKDYFSDSDLRDKTQIDKEINYFNTAYKGIKPRMVISYFRQAYSGANEHDLRLTFDDKILWRDEDLSLTSDIYGKELLPNKYVLMELKVTHAIPLWLTSFLSENKIYKSSFSKYGNAYTMKMREQINSKNSSKEKEKEKIKNKDNKEIA